jgi:hypothetical protein
MSIQLLPGPVTVGRVVWKSIDDVISLPSAWRNASSTALRSIFRNTVRPPASQRGTAVSPCG